jgi:chromosome segregation ATPase
MITEFLKENWSQILLLAGGIIAYFTGRQTRLDKHLYDKSMTFNIDIDSLSGSFNLSQKMLATVRTQLDETQASLDKANEAYKVLKKELFKAMNEIDSYRAKVKVLDKENKFLIEKLNTCDITCENKVNTKRNSNKNKYKR